MIARLLCTAALALTLVPSADAQLTEKQAVKALGAVIKSADQGFKSALDEATKDGVVVIKDFTKAASEEGFGNVEIQAFFLEFAAVQRAIRDAYDSALLAIAMGGNKTLVDFANAPGETASLVGKYPDAFYEGQGGALAAAKASLKKRAEKAARKFGGALKKAVKQVEKATDFDFRYHVLPVQPTFDITLREEGLVTDNFRTATRLSVDWVLSWAPESGSLGTMYANGTGAEDGRVGVGFATDAPALLSTVAVMEVVDGRWSRLLTFPKGNYVVSVFEDADGDEAGHGPSLAIGVG